MRRRGSGDEACGAAVVRAAGAVRLRRIPIAADHRTGGGRQAGACGGRRGRTQVGQGDAEAGERFGLVAAATGMDASGGRLRAHARRAGPFLVRSEETKSETQSLLRITYALL